MQNNYLLKISKFFLYLVPFSIVIVYGGTLFPFIVSKYVFFRIAVELALVFFLWAWVYGEVDFKGLKERVCNPLFISTAVFAFIFVLAGFLGFNPAASFWSNFERGEGGFQMLHLIAFFVLMALAFKDWKAWRKMFIVSIWAAILMIGYGILGIYGAFGFIGQSLCTRFAGSLGNPAYVGTYLIFSIFYAAILLLGDWKEDLLSLKKIKKWLWFVLLALFLVFMLLSQTRGAILGFAGAALIFLIYLVFAIDSKKLKKLFLVLIAGFVILGSLGVKYRNSIDLMPFCAGGGNRILDITLKTENAQTRFLLWQEAVKAFGDHPLFGWGPENFTPAFEKYYDTRFTVWYDRAHNIFFDYLVMTGLLGLLSFIAIFVSFYWQFFAKVVKKAQDNKGKIKNAIIFSLPIAYLIQGLVLFDVLPIYINLFIFLAFANFIFTSILDTNQKNVKRI